MLDSKLTDIEPGQGGAAFESRFRIILTSLWILIGVAAFGLAFGPSLDMDFLEEILAPFRHHIQSDKALYSPAAYFCLLSLAYILERIIPVRKQAFFSNSFRQDILWYFGSVAFRVVFLGYYVLLLQSFYRDYLYFLSVPGVADWHPLARFFTAILVADFTRWFSHLLRHKVPVFWSFHAVHHSQQELNIFTDARVHPVDRIFSATISFIPLMMFENSPPVIMGWLIFETIYPKFYHANVRLNFGPLRYLLVTPQSHRVHHGVELQHRDKNFGFTFSIWDWIFGTQYRDHTDYPATGIEDAHFPHEQRGSMAAIARTFVAQLVYPFRYFVRPRRT